jgi:hypothetical protein
MYIKSFAKKIYCLISEYVIIVTYIPTIIDKNQSLSNMERMKKKSRFH